MRLTVILFLCFSFVINIYGQNLVPNPSFEAIKDTINGFTYSDVEFTSKIHNWTAPNKTSPDMITPDFSEGFVQPPPPRSGSTMVGIQANVRSTEYVGVRLTKALSPNRTYHVEYWIRRARSPNPQMDTDRMMNANFGILFSRDSIKTTNDRMLAGPPQAKADTAVLVTAQEWLRVSTYFTPKEPYQYLYIGQFRKAGERPVIMTGYYVIDDVLVEEITDYEALDKGVSLPVGSVIPLENVNFISGSTQFSDQKSYEVLGELNTYLQANPSMRICINGHTDAVGAERTNWVLSKKRARAVAQRLIQGGLRKDRIEWKGFGENSPIADNNTAQGRAENRRVEFEVVQ